MAYSVRKRGEYYWMFGWVKGIRLDCSLGTTNRKLAEKISEDKFRRALERAHGVRVIKNIKLKELMDKYIDYCKSNNRQSTFEKKKFNVVNLLRHFVDIPLSRITPEQIEQYKDKRLAKVSPATVNRDLSTLKHALNLAVRWGYLESSPATSVVKLKEPKGRLRYLTREEADALIGECSNELRPIVITALHTGMRLGEILSLEWEDVDLKRSQIKIFDTKNNDFRVVPMNETLYNTLLKLNPKRGRVFLSRLGAPYKHVRKNFKRALRRVRIKDFKFHDLRHTFASWLAMEGIPLSTIGKLMGHKTPHMTMRYAHLSQDYLQDVVEVLTQKRHKEEDGRKLKVISY